MVPLPPLDATAAPGRGIPRAVPEPPAEPLRDRADPLDLSKPLHLSDLSEPLPSLEPSFPREQGRRPPDQPYPPAEQPTPAEQHPGGQRYPSPERRAPAEQQPDRRPVERSTPEHPGAAPYVARGQDAGAGRSLAPAPRTGTDPSGTADRGTGAAAPVGLRVPPPVPAPTLEELSWPAPDRAGNGVENRVEADPPNVVSISSGRPTPRPVSGGRRLAPQPIAQARRPAIPAPRAVPAGRPATMPAPQPVAGFTPVMPLTDRVQPMSWSSDDEPFRSARTEEDAHHPDGEWWPEAGSDRT